MRRDPSIDVVLAGHSHLPALIEVEANRYYVNTGDWISHMTYAVLRANGGPPEIRRWPDRVIYSAGDAARGAALEPTETS